MSFLKYHKKITRSNIFELHRNDENSNVYKIVSQILQKNCSGKLISLQEVFFRLMSEEYFMITRQFARVDIGSLILNRNGTSNVPDYITAYFQRPFEMDKLSIFQFMKDVLLIKYEQIIDIKFQV